MGWASSTLGKRRKMRTKLWSSDLRDLDVGWKLELKNDFDFQRTVCRDIFL